MLSSRADTAAEAAGQSPEHQLSAAQRLFARISADMLHSLDDEQLLQQLARLFVPDLGDYCIIDVLDERGGLARAALAHASPEQEAALAALRRFAPGDRPSSPQRRVLESGAPLLQPEVDEPFLAATAANAEHLRWLRETGVRSAMIVPLQARGDRFGTVALGSCDPARRYSQQELLLAVEVADRAALMIDNARLYAAERAARAASELATARATFLGAASAVFAESLELTQTFRELVRLSVPRFADVCVVFLCGPGDALERAAFAHRDPEAERMMEQLHRLGPRLALASDHPAAEVARSGQTLRNPPLAGPYQEIAASDGPLAATLRANVPHDGIMAPLVARQRVLGALYVGLVAPGRRYSPEDVALVEGLARRAALAADNARLYQEAQEAVQARDRFLSLASHELKTPLTALIGQAQLLQRRLQRGQLDPARDRRAVAVVIEQSQRLNHLVSTLLDVSRIDQGRLTLSLSRVELGGLAEQVVARCQGAMRQHSLDYSPPEGPLEAEVDGPRIAQVLESLILNAVRYSPAGGPIRVALGRRGGRAALSVQDAGVGIAAENLPLLFHRYYRADNAATSHVGGLGVGLYIVKEIVERHGGEITVESRLAEGSRFTVLLPLPAGSEAAP